MSDKRQDNQSMTAGDKVSGDKVSVPLLEVLCPSIKVLDLKRRGLEAVLATALLAVLKPWSAVF